MERHESIGCHSSADGVPFLSISRILVRSVGHTQGQSVGLSGELPLGVDSLPLISVPILVLYRLRAFLRRGTVITVLFQDCSHFLTLPFHLNKCPYLSMVILIDEWFRRCSITFA